MSSPRQPENSPAADGKKAEDLLPVVYAELRHMAQRQMMGQAGAHTLGATGLVHEVCLKLLGSEADWASRTHLLAVGATAMRQVLKNHARDKAAAKRGGGDGERARVTLSGLADSSSDETADLDSVLLCLERLTAVDERQARIVEFRYLAGMSLEQVAHITGLSRATVARECRAARAWMRAALDEARG